MDLANHERSGREGHEGWDRARKQGSKQEDWSPSIQAEQGAMALIRRFSCSSVASFVGCFSRLPTNVTTIAQAVPN
eukprot:1155966-Pelagomonas_calceolata.AAC.4